MEREKESEKGHLQIQLQHLCQGHVSKRVCLQDLSASWHISSVLSSLLWSSPAFLLLHTCTSSPPFAFSVSGVFHSIPPTITLPHSTWTQSPHQVCMYLSLCCSSLFVGPSVQLPSSCNSCSPLSFSPLLIVFWILFVLDPPAPCFCMCDRIFVCIRAKRRIINGTSALI